VARLLDLDGRAHRVAGVVLLLHHGPQEGEDRGGETNELYLVEEELCEDLDWEVG